MADNSRTNLDYAALLPLRLPDGPQQMALYRALRGLIEEGALPPGARLPPTRQLAERFGIARGAAVAAYEVLSADGFAEARVGAGTFVARHVPRLGKDPPVAPAIPETRHDLPGAIGVGTPDPRTSEVLRRLISRHLAELPPSLFHYGDPRGLLVLREGVAEYLRTARGVRCTAHNIVMTAGSQQGIDLVVRALMAPGDPVWFEDPGYTTGRRALEGAGLRLAAVPVDEEGLDVAAGEAIAPRARAAYVTPSHQFPLGVAMTMRRRLALVDWAQRADAVVIEDDYDSEFRFAGAPLTALQGIDDGGRVIYVGTFSKVLFPGLRLGYLVVPEAFLERVLEVRSRTDRFPPALLEPALAEFLHEGHFSSHLRRVRRAARAARDGLVETLQALGLTVDPPDQGLHLIAGLPPGHRDTDIAERANAAGFGARALSPMYLGPPRREGLVIGFGGCPPEVLCRAARDGLGGLAR